MRLCFSQEKTFFSGRKKTGPKRAADIKPKATFDIFLLSPLLPVENLP